MVRVVYNLLITNFLQSVIEHNLLMSILFSYIPITSPSNNFPISPSTSNPPITSFFISFSMSNLSYYPSTTISLPLNIIPFLNYSFLIIQQSLIPNSIFVPHRILIPTILIVFNNPLHFSSFLIFVYSISKYYHYSYYLIPLLIIINLPLFLLTLISDSLKY